MKRYRIIISVILGLILANEACANSAEYNVPAVPDFASYKDVKQKKKVFFDYFNKLLVISNARIEQERNMILKTISAHEQTGRLTKQQALLIQSLANKYGVD